MNVETGTQLVLQPIMPLDLPVKVRSWELTVYPVHLKPYWGKPAVRNFRGGRGNPKLNRARRAPLPYSALILAASPFLLDDPVVIDDLDRDPA